MEDKATKKSTVYSTTLVDSQDKLIEYCTLTVHKEGTNVEFSVITSSGQAYVGSQNYEGEK